MIKAVIQLETLVCPSCSLKIEKAIKSLDGIDKESLNVLFNSSKVKVEFDDSIVSIERINETIKSVGFEVIKSSTK